MNKEQILQEPTEEELQKMMHDLFSKSIASMSRRDRRKVERSMKKASLKK
jgi:predicted KAP-like P-loop ATPase